MCEVSPHCRLLSRRSTQQAGLHAPFGVLFAFRVAFRVSVTREWDKGETLERCAALHEPRKTAVATLSLAMPPTPKESGANCEARPPGLRLPLAAAATAAVPAVRATLLARC